MGLNLNLFIVLLAYSSTFIFFFINGKRKTRKMQDIIDIKEKRLKSTSRLLIQKNFELIDNNLRLQMLLGAKTDFVSIASHQLRTPATELKWGVQYMLEGALGEYTKEQHSYIEKILVSVNKMIHLINELLFFVRSEGDITSMKFVPYPIDTLVYEVLTQSSEHFKNKAIITSISSQFGQKVVPIDIELIRIVLTNLIDNAFQYTPVGGTIRIETKEKNDAYCFEITDSGVGIPENNQHEIFSKFKRSKQAMHANPEGIGLGLYIAKNIIDKHKGNLSFHSTTEGTGTTFLFTLPLRASVEKKEDLRLL